MLKHLSSEPGSSPKEEIPRTVRARRVVEWAEREAEFLHHDCIGTDDLLLGMMRESEEWQARDWPGPHHLRAVCEAVGLSFRDLRGRVIEVRNEAALLA